MGGRRLRLDPVREQQDRYEHLVGPGVGTGLRITAVWRKEPADEIQVYGWSYENYRARYDRLWPQGYRLHALETAVVDGQVSYSAVWRKGAVPEVQVYGWTSRT